MKPTKKSKRLAQQPNEGFQLFDEDRATLHAMAQKYGFGDDIAEFFAQLMVEAAPIRARHSRFVDHGVEFHGLEPSPDLLEQAQGEGEPADEERANEAKPDARCKAVGFINPPKSWREEPPGSQLWICSKCQRSVVVIHIDQPKKGHSFEEGYCECSKKRYAVGLTIG